MTPSGKIQKYRLRELVAERIAAERRRRWVTASLWPVAWPW